MAIADATCFPPKNQAYRLISVIMNGSTGAVITGGLTGLSCSISKDGVNFVSTTNAPAEIGTSGYFTLDLTAAEMNANAIAINVTASNTNAISRPIFLNPIDLSEFTGHWYAQPVKRLEQGLMQLFGYFFNKVSRNNNTGLITARNYADSANAYTMPTSNDGASEVKERAS